MSPAPSPTEHTFLLTDRTIECDTDACVFSEMSSGGQQVADLSDMYVGNGSSYNVSCANIV